MPAANVLVTTSADLGVATSAPTLSDAVTALPAVYTLIDKHGEIVSIEAGPFYPPVRNVMDSPIVGIKVQVSEDCLRSLVGGGIVRVWSASDERDPDSDRFNLNAFGSLFDVPLAVYCGHVRGEERWWEPKTVTRVDEPGAGDEPNVAAPADELPIATLMRRFVSTEDDEPITLADLANLNGWDSDDERVTRLSLLGLNDSADVGDGGASGSFVFTRID